MLNLIYWCLKLLYKLPGMNAKWKQIVVRVLRGMSAGFRFLCQLGREKIDYEWNKINKLAFVTKVILKAEVWLPFMMFPMVKTIYNWQNKYEW